MASDSHSDLRRDWSETPHPSRFDPDRADYRACLDAHGKAVEAGELGYLDPFTGLFVMTASGLAQRPCCNRGCRHCPYIDGP